MCVDQPNNWTQFMFHVPKMLTISAPVFQHLKRNCAHSYYNNRTVSLSLFCLFCFLPRISLFTHVAVCVLSCCHWTTCNCKWQHPIKNWVELHFGPKMFIIKSRKLYVRVSACTRTAHNSVSVCSWNVLNELNKIAPPWNEMCVLIRVYVNLHVFLCRPLLCVAARCLAET